jgi:hypothetical protein
MTNLDEQHEELRDRGSGARMNISDPRVSAVLNWIWTALGGLALLIGVGMYNKLANMNDTLLIAVSKLETQGSQIVDLRNDVSKLREENAVLRTQIAVIEGKVQRGIQEFIHGR